MLIIKWLLIDGMDAIATINDITALLVSAVAIKQERNYSRLFIDKTAMMLDKIAV